MTMFDKIMRWIDPDYLFWALLSTPGLFYLFEYMQAFDGSELYKRLSFRTAELSAYLFLATLMATPLQLLFRGRFGSRWLVRKRRYIGVAALFYGIAHAICYLGHTGSLAAVTREFFWPPVLTGWLVLALLIPVGWTSRDRSVRNLGRNWKKVQQLVYPAAALTFVHWAIQFGGQVAIEATLFFLPLAALSIYRYRRTLSFRKHRTEEAEV